MSFTVTITGIPDKELGTFLAAMRLPKKASYTTEHTPDHVALIEGPRKHKHPYANGSTPLTMTGKKPTRSKALTTALTMFEKLEKRKGIGTVTVDGFRADLKKRNQKPTMVNRMVAEGYLSYLR